MLTTIKTETDLWDARRVRHSKRVSTQLLVVLVVLVLVVWTVQPPQVCLAVERRADLERRRGRRRHATQGQNSLVGDAGPRHGAP